MIKNKFLLAFTITILTFNSAFLESSNLVIKNAEIYDGIENDSYQGHILISDGVITKISKTSAPYADKVYDAGGRVVTPGFIAPDTQIGIIEIGALSVTRDDEANVYNIGFSIHDAFNPNSVLIPWNRANGITSAITLPRNTSSPIGGLGSFFILDSKLEITSEPDIAMIGRLGGSGSSSRSESLALIDDILSFASSIEKKNMLSDSSIDEIIDDSSIASHMNFKPRDVKALYRLLNDGLPIIIKSHRASDIIKLIELKNTYDLNLIIMGAQEASLVVDEIAKNNIPLIVNPINNIPNSFDELASNINMTSMLEKAGVTLMFNVSRSHNYHLIRQGAGVAVANGMSYGGAIKALTSNVAETFNLQDRGSIKVGNIADIVVWEADPLEPSSMPEKVFINGIDTDLTTRSSRLRDRYIKDLGKPNTYRN
ncbi:amidohydrolase family protein [Gammaproteobacteria bacterium]|nr:amidohydrolase family protein [Gammaproteobacteria bacterium]